MCTFGTGFAQRTTSENVVAQMNYCIYSLTNIIDNKSMTVLEHETDQLTSNLTVENIIGLYEINDFRQDLLDALGRFQITEEERSLMRRIQSIQRDNMKMVTHCQMLYLQLCSFLAMLVHRWLSMYY